MSMFTDRELAALRRMQATVRVEYSPYWWPRDVAHISIGPRTILNKGGWVQLACGKHQGRPNVSIVVSRSDLHFLRMLCPSCLAAIRPKDATTRQEGPKEARHGHARPEVGLGAAPQRKLMRYAAQTAEEEETL